MAKPVEVIGEILRSGVGTSSLNGLGSALRRLDRLLELAVTRAQTLYGVGAEEDAYRGLYLSEEDAGRLLAREPCEPTLSSEIEEESEPVNISGGDGARLAWLIEAFGLSHFDVDVLLIALAPELDQRYERLYAYLQDDMTRQRPSVELALNLLCRDAESKLERREHFSTAAPLIRQRLIYLDAPARHHSPTLLDYALKVDEQIVNFLLSHESLDARLVSFCRLLQPQARLDLLPLSRATKRALVTLVFQARTERQPLRLYFHGARGAGKREAAEAIACAAGAPLLVADVAGGLASRMDFGSTIKTLFREAWFRDAIVYLDGFDELLTDEHATDHRRVLEELAEDAGVSILAGVQSSAGQALAFSQSGLTGVLEVPFDIPKFALREKCWRDRLAAAGLELEARELAALAGRFRLMPAQILCAIDEARNRARWREAVRPLDEPPEAVEQTLLGNLFAAARAQSGFELAAVARKVEPVYTWDDIVLPDDTVAQLRELCQRVSHRQRVLGEWGFDLKLSLGKGANALFAGASGVGKTMAAEIIARELGLDLYKIDLSGVVSKYIGETEKNLDRIFAAAENANAILFFDEADALFGKRSEVRDSHDRYANIEISYLLQKMEEYEGIAILATNLRQNLDESFVRRLAFNINFPFPNEVSRRRIWAGIWPQQVPLDKDVDVEFLARQFKLSGGNIKNIALAAAFFAAEQESPVRMAHLLRATRREYQKMGKLLSEAELYGSIGDAPSGSNANGHRAASALAVETV